ncbi:hypothetical protein SLA2020_468300 [Shorea laevis]
MEPFGPKAPPYTAYLSNLMTYKAINVLEKEKTCFHTRKERIKSCLHAEGNQLSAKDHRFLYSFALRSFGDQCSHNLHFSDKSADELPEISFPTSALWLVILSSLPLRLCFSLRTEVSFSLLKM